MKQHLNLILRSAFVALLAGLAAGAYADTQNLTVTATVRGVCKFTSAARTLNFDIDPSTPGTISGAMSGAVTYKCTKDTVGTGVTAGNGLHFSGSRRMSDGGATPTYLPYTLTVSGGTATGTGFGTGSTDSTITITGTVAESDYANLPVSSYSDTVLLTLTP